ncbi:MAG: amidohydrolase/deacetylase family metallohydrolase [Cyclobacteriaceae bacterium]|nr:amidohydrolase/deacetylase family metallohydrolase [Cyclobacteriaceae bacterium SS2]
MKNSYTFFGILVIFFLGCGTLIAQPLDLLITKGHVIDPKNNINAVMDVGIADGKIAEIGSKITTKAKKTIDASGLYVVPGLIDIHGHHHYGTEPDHYLSNGYSALPPDGFTFRSGVTTVVDAGGAGWQNFGQFKEQAIDNSRTRVLAFLNIVGAGMRGGAYEQNAEDMDPKLTAMVARRYSEYIVGIKLAHYSGEEWGPTDMAVEAGELADIPVMVDFGGSEPPLSLQTLFLEKLRPGDIFTHCFANVNGREPIVEDGKLRPFVKTAQDRGIIFDVGHGGGSFLYAQAVPAIKQGFRPNSISTDLHTGSMNGGMKDMINVMSKLLNIGMTLDEVIECSTWNPAKIIKREELGNLSVGSGADVALISVDKGKFGYIDIAGYKMNGDKRIVCQLTLRDGRVVWDLNGLAAIPFNEK